MKVSTLAILFMFSGAIAGNCTQTDWSGGVSPVEVVPSWGNTYLESSGISSAAIAGQICLGSVPRTMPVELPVAPDISLTGLSSGDLNGDGLVDLVGSSLKNGNVYWFRNTGDGQWNAETLPGSFSGALGCAMADMDSDGYPDVVAGVAEPDMILLWKNQDGTGPGGDPVVIDPLFPGVHGVIGCQVDADGIMDLIAAGNECSQIAVWYGLGGDSWQKVVIDSTFLGTQSVSPGDFDSDGDMDIAGAALQLGEFAWWENPGNRSEPWQKHMVADGMTSAHHVVAVDLNTDELIDILGSCFGISKIIWWENNGTSPSGWEPHTVAPALTGVLTAIPADFDGDGDLDVAGAGWSIDRILWYENIDGSAENWLARTVDGSFNGAWPLASGDFNGNGRLGLAAGADVLNGPGTSHGLSIYDLCSFQDNGSITSCILDTDETPQWASFESQLQIPPATSAEFYWRSSNDFGSMGDWTGPFPGCGDLSGVLERFVQYRVELTSEDPERSPVLSELALYWDPAGVDPEETDGKQLFRISGNPCSSGYIRITLEPCASGGETCITVLDITGRIIDAAWGTSEHMVLGPFEEGVYLLHGTSGGENFTDKAVMLRSGSGLGAF